MRLLLLLASAFLLHPASAGAAASSVKAGDGCTAAEAVDGRIDRIQAGLDIWLERCVRLRGIAAGGRLYASRAALAEAVRPNDDVPTGSIALYPVAGVAPPRKAAWVELVGRVGSCAMAHDMVERLSAGQPGQILMVTGYCHTSIEAYVEPISIRPVTKGEVDRLTEAELPESKRLLVAAETRGEAIAYVAAAKALVAAIAAGDETSFRRLVSPDSQNELDQLHGNPVPDWLREDLAAAHKAFLAARSGNGFAGLGDAKLFLLRDEMSEAKPSEHFVCFCRTERCAGKWPVAPFDADLDPARPYACVLAHDHPLARGGQPAVAVQIDWPGFGLQEPKWADDRARFGGG
jgi:hypothetical protein